MPRRGEATPFAFAIVLACAAEALEVECLLNCLARTRTKHTVLVLCSPELQQTAQSLVGRLRLLSPLSSTGAPGRGASAAASVEHRIQPSLQSPDGALSPNQSKGAVFGEDLRRRRPSPLPRAALSAAGEISPRETSEGKRGGRFRVVVVPVSGQPELWPTRPFLDEEEEASWKSVLRLQLKPEAWRLVHFEKILLLDPNCLVLRSVDFLFDRRVTDTRPAMAPSLTPPDRFDCGVILLKPSREVYSRLSAHVRREVAAWKKCFETGKEKAASLSSRPRPPESACSAGGRESPSGQGLCSPSSFSALPEELEESVMNAFFPKWFEWEEVHRLPFKCNAHTALLRGFGGDFSREEGSPSPSSSTRAAASRVAFGGGAGSSKADRLCLPFSERRSSTSVSRDEAAEGLLRGVGSASLGFGFVVSAMKSLVAELAGQRPSSRESSALAGDDAADSDLSLPSSKGASFSETARSASSSPSAQEERETLSPRNPSSAPSSREEERLSTANSGADSGGEFQIASQETLSRELSAHVRQLLAASRSLVGDASEGSALLLGPTVDEAEPSVIKEKPARPTTQLQLPSAGLSSRLLSAATLQPNQEFFEGRLGKERSSSRSGGVLKRPSRREAAFAASTLPPWWVASKPFFILRLSDARERVERRRVSSPLDVLWWRAFLGLDPLGDEELAVCV